MAEYLPQIVLVIGIWMIGNGVLHDAFVLARHTCILLLLISML